LKSRYILQTYLFWFIFYFKNYYQKSIIASFSFWLKSFSKHTGSSFFMRLQKLAPVFLRWRLLYNRGLGFLSQGSLETINSLIYADPFCLRGFSTRNFFLSLKKFKKKDRSWRFLFRRRKRSRKRRRARRKVVRRNLNRILPPFYKKIRKARRRLKRAIRKKKRNFRRFRNPRRTKRF
jgi:hypothetical protein